MAVRTTLCCLATAFACTHGAPRSASVAPTPEWIAGPLGRLRVDAGGPGPGVPVLLLHGLGLNWTTWKAQLEHLRASRRAAAFDLPGMGESDPPAGGDYSLDAMASSIGAVADGLGYERFVLVGASYSGLLVGKYAAEHPGRVAAVVLADGAFDPSTWPPGALDGMVRGFRERWPAAMEEVLSGALANASEPVRSAAFAMVRSTPRETVISTYAGMAHYDARGTLARYPGPKLSIAAEALDEPKAVHHTLPVPVRMMKGVSHMVMMDRPEEFNGYLDEFLAGVR